MAVDLPRNHRLAERDLIRAVNEEVLLIDSDGAVWRTAIRRAGDRTVSVKPRRAEKATPQGYLMVRVMRDGKRVCGLAHRLVWQAAHGDIPAGMCINHKNGDKADNRLSNLEVVSYSENSKHARRTGLLDQNGESNPAHKLTDEAVVKIRQIYAGGETTQAQLGEMFGVREGTISKIIKGQRRKRQGGAVDPKDHRHISTGRDPKSGRFLPSPADLRVQEWPR